MPRGEPLPAHAGSQPHGNGVWRPLFVLVVAATFVRAGFLGRPFVADNEGTACGPLLVDGFIVYRLY